MSFVRTLFMLTALLTLTGPGRTFAAEVADGEMTSVAIPAVERGLRPSDAGRLIRGELPSLGRLDQKYRGRSIDYTCRNTWADLRSTVVRPRAVRPSLAAFRVNAEKAGLPFRKLKNALAVFLKNQDSLPNQHHITIVDFDKSSSQKRLFTVDLQTGRVDSFFTSAGRGSDPDGDGYATQFSNATGSQASSLGCYVAAGEYRSPTKNNRRSLVLHGLEASNDNACQRHVVMHPARYVGSGAGRSFGCLAVLPKDVGTVYGRVGGGGLICSYREGAITEATARAPRSSRHSSSRHRPRHHRSRHHGRSYAAY